jgi:hypothetical protein
VTTDTIFSGQAQPNQGGEATPAKTEETGLLTALVGEKQKYRSVEELAKGYVNADEHIKRLEEENRKLREAQAAAKTLDDVLERMQTKQEEPKTQAPVQAVSAEQIAQLVEQTLTGRETAKTREANLLAADKLMKEKFGDKAAEVFKGRASTPELQRVYMEMAAIDPQQFIGMFGGSAPAPQGNVAMPSVSTTSVSPSSNRVNVEWSKEWVAKTRKENPTLYWSTEFQSKLASTVAQNPSLYFGN